MSLNPDNSDSSTTSRVNPNVILDSTLDNSQSNYSTTNNRTQTQTTRNDQRQQHQQQIRCRRELNRISKLKCQKHKVDLVNSLRAEVAQLTAMHNALRAENQQLCQEFLACCNALVQKPVDHQHLFCNEQVVGQELVQHHDAPMQESLAQPNQVEAYLSLLLANPSMTATSALHCILPVATTTVPQSVAHEGFVMMSRPSSTAHSSNDDAGIESAHIWPSIMAVLWSGTPECNVASLPYWSVDRDMGIESPCILPFESFPWSGTQEDYAASQTSSVVAHDLDHDGQGIESLLEEQPGVTLGPKEAVVDNQ